MQASCPVAEVVISPIELEDNIAIRNVISEVRDEFNCSGKDHSVADFSLQMMYQTYQQTGFAFFVVKKNGEVLGGAGIAPLDGVEGVCELQKLYLHRSLRGFGVGELLIQYCLEEAGNLGYTACYLETAKQLFSAQKLFRKAGFSEIPERLGNTGHSGCDLFFYFVMQMDSKKRGARDKSSPLTKA